MHWVTVVAITMERGCRVHFNHWGRQDVLTCNTFLERWSLGDTLAGRVALTTRILQPFTFVCQTESATETAD